MSRNHITCCALAIILVVVSCRETENASSDTTFEQVYQQFHGKYEIIHSTSDQEVDINRDGVESTDLLQEIPNLESARLELRIVEKSLIGSGSIYLFVQSWPEQHVPDRIAEDPSALIHYPMQGVVRTFILNESKNVLQVEEDEDTATDLEKFPLHESVTVNDEGQIQVIVQKRILTTEGWQNLRITTLYTRYTMST
ncbi:hypothetical protein [Tunicatimonas pelagia]|uniref:hypothetical protein n=1 Tax=Tunicatimonas pelagia TaxID=931531 RepID=UPI00266536B1|nr:hypothetical protein [Tunicatimonas pelagia]WKN43769.1 hypothetical protein P0M28_02130 [Tunicatimonas pelagia]